jgi:hypothetical protein
MLSAGNGLFSFHGDIAAADRGRVGATSYLTPHEAIAVDQCEGVFVCFERGHRYIKGLSWCWSSLLSFAFFA